MDYLFCSCLSSLVFLVYIFPIYHAPGFLSAIWFTKLTLAIFQTASLYPASHSVSFRQASRSASLRQASRSAIPAKALPVPTSGVPADAPPVPEPAIPANILSVSESSIPADFPVPTDINPVPESADIKPAPDHPSALWLTPAPDLQLPASFPNLQLTAPALNPALICNCIFWYWLSHLCLRQSPEQSRLWHWPPSIHPERLVGLQFLFSRGPTSTNTLPRPPVWSDLRCHPPVRPPEGSLCRPPEGTHCCHPARLPEGNRLLCRPPPQPPGRSYLRIGLQIQSPCLKQTCF
ncbi:uncharacterized protein LOC120793645 [Xiphias gladius]|uniref:uncharacterized protein LOC120793645 n=1 Tax=Xiphias gladius TaxID=8245 RepID=UPI001A99DC59|nr:uncharacterized protein LOC120793645 [Xiphias gladius]